MLSFDSAIRALKFCSKAQTALMEAKWDPQLLSQRVCEIVTKGICTCNYFHINFIGGNVIFRGLRVRMGMHIGTPTVVTDPVSGILSTNLLYQTFSRSSRLFGN